MTEHTALPWYVHPDYKASIMASKGQVATALRRFTFNPTKLIPEDEWQANARFIVTACNCHADLLEALKWAIDWADGLVEVFGPQPAWVPKAQQAIRKAEETQ